MLASLLCSIGWWVRDWHWLIAHQVWQEIEERESVSIQISSSIQLSHYVVYCVICSWAIGHPSSIGRHCWVWRQQIIRWARSSQEILEQVNGAWHAKTDKECTDLCRSGTIPCRCKRWHHLQWCCTLQVAHPDRLFLQLWSAKEKVERWKSNPTCD